MNESMRYGKQKKLTNRYNKTFIETTRNSNNTLETPLINNWQHWFRSLRPYNIVIRSLQ